VRVSRERKYSFYIQSAVKYVKMRNKIYHRQSRVSALPVKHVFTSDKIADSAFAVATSESSYSAYKKLTMRYLLLLLAYIHNCGVFTRVNCYRQCKLFPDLPSCSGLFL
jgi:hypothetical protein